MKKVHLIGILIIAISIGVLMSLSGEVSTYSNFAEAAAKSGDVQIAGRLIKEKEMYYDPAVDPNYFTFYVEDAEGQERKVVLLQERPQDFEQSEQVVLTGRMIGDEFVANHVLLKCPSKYKDEEIALRKKAQS